MPVADWQFWVVTLPVVLIVGAVVRRVVRLGIRARRGDAAERPGVPTRLTIGGDPVRRR